MAGIVIGLSSSALNKRLESEISLNIRAVSETIWQPILLLGAAVFYSIPGLTPFTPHAIPAFLPLGLALVGMTLGWRFHRSSALYALVALVLTYLALDLLNGRPPARDVYGQVLYAGISILLPVNLTIWAYLEERGLLNRFGLFRLFTLIAQAGILYNLTVSDNAQLIAEAEWLFHFRLLPPDIDQWTYLPQPALIAYALSFLLLTAHLLVTASPLSGGLLGALLASAAAFHLVGNPIAVDSFLTAAIAIITAAVVQDTFRMAFIDELTGIPGRRALIADMKRLGGRYVIAMADIDHFKSFNDTHGHDVGDQVLQMVAERLSRISGGGKAYRYGGEEFTILMPGKNLETAEPCLEDVRQLVEQSNFQIRGKERAKSKSKKKPRPSNHNVVSVTVSIGAAQSEGAAVKPDAIMKSADKALYRAKKAGRNQLAS